jgi:molybdate transport system substrate-binding protein
MQGGRIWEIPAEMHPPIEQAAIVLKGARKQQAARSFLEFMKSESGRRILEKFGFSVPQSSSRAAVP